MITKTGAELAGIGLEKDAFIRTSLKWMGDKLSGIGRGVSDWVSTGATKEGFAGNMFRRAQSGIDNAALANRSIQSNWKRLSKKGKAGVGIGAAGIFGGGYMLGGDDENPPHDPVYKTY